MNSRLLGSQFTNIVGGFGHGWLDEKREEYGPLSYNVQPYYIRVHTVCTALSYTVSIGFTDTLLRNYTCTTIKQLILIVVPWCETFDSGETTKHQNIKIFEHQKKKKTNEYCISIRLNLRCVIFDKVSSHQLNQYKEL